MKKLFAIVAVMGVLTFGSTQLVQAQDAAATEQAAPAADKPVADAVAEAAEASAPLAGAEEGGIHKEIKVKFIEGTASFMSLVAIALVIGLAFCIERIIYLSLAESTQRSSWLLLKLLWKKVTLKLLKTSHVTLEVHRFYLLSRSDEN